MSIYFEVNVKRIHLEFTCSSECVDTIVESIVLIYQIIGYHQSVLAVFVPPTISNTRFKLNTISLNPITQYDAMMTISIFIQLVGYKSDKFFSRNYR